MESYDRKMICPYCRKEIESIGKSNDNLLIEFCKYRPRSVNELAKSLKISPKNVSVRLKRLEKANLIKVNRQGIGKKTLIIAK